MGSVIDPQQFKLMQRQGWDSVAEGWKKWWKTIEEGGQVLSDRLVELSGIKEGSQVLDIATGIGEPAVTAAKKVGPSGKVVAVDISPAMLAIAKERTKEHGLDNIIEFQEGDIESLNLPSSKFNAVTSRFGLMFLPGLPKALKAIRGALVDGGTIAAAVWPAAPKVPFIYVALDVVMKETATLPPPSGTPGPFSLADTNLLRQKFEQAGFRDIVIENLTITFKLPSPEEYVDFVRSTAAPLTAMMKGLSPARQAEIWSKVTDAARKHIDTATGRAVFTNEAICVSAKR